MTGPSAGARGRRRFGRWGVVVGCVLSLFCWSAAGRATTAGPAAVSVEDEPVRYHLPPAGTTGHEPATPPGPTANAVGDLSHVVVALAIIIGIIFGLRWVARRLALVPTVGRSGRGVRLLSRTVLSPKQQVLLIQVGRRVVVVGDAGAAGMRPLCEITDPDEVAALIGDVKSAEANGPAAKSFGNLFRRAAEPFGGDDAEPPALGPTPSAGDEVSSDVVGLLDKVRGLRQQFER